MKKSIPHTPLPCHKIYRVEAVGLKSHDFCEYVKFGGNIVKKWYFVNNCLIKVLI